MLRRVVYPAMSRAGLFSRGLRAGEVCVLTYHGVFPSGYIPNGSPVDRTLISSAQFRRQLRFLKSHYTLITPEHFRQWCLGTSALPPRAVLLTCDDGLLGALEMLPALCEESIECLFFVTAASTEERAAYLWYDDLYEMLRQGPRRAVIAMYREETGTEQQADQDIHTIWHFFLGKLSALSYASRRGALSGMRQRLCVKESTAQSEKSRHRLMNRGELQQLAVAGMTVGAHTVSHPRLTAMSPELAEAEIRDARALLESCLDRHIWALAYPFGDNSSVGVREAGMAERAGYTCAFMNCGGGRLRRTNSQFTFPRAHVSSDVDIPELEARLTGFVEGLRDRFSYLRSQQGRN